MTHAELLRKHATDATNEGGVWFSGEYMTMLAIMAESIEDENAQLRQQLADATESMGRVEERCAKLRELVTEMYPYAKAFLQQGVMLGCNDTMSYDWFLQLRDLGIEVSE